MALLHTFSSLLFLLICLFSLARSEDEDVNTNPEPKDFNGFIMTVPDCEYQLYFANDTLTLYGNNWKNVLEEARHNFTNVLGQCKNEMNNTLYYLPQVSDVLSYASSIGECPDSYAECLGKNGWMITAIIFIILFLLTVGALATVVVFQVKKNNSMHA